MLPSCGQNPELQVSGAMWQLMLLAVAVPFPQCGTAAGAPRMRLSAPMLPAAVRRKWQRDPAGRCLLVRKSWRRSTFAVPVIVPAARGRCCLRAAAWRSRAVTSAYTMPGSSMAARHS